MRNVREYLTRLSSKVPDDAKILVLWVDKDEKVLRMSQTNCDSTDVLKLSEGAMIAAQQGLNLEKGGR
jgi:hypothetical protein